METARKFKGADASEKRAMTLAAMGQSLINASKAKAIDRTSELRVVMGMMSVGFGMLLALREERLDGVALDLSMSVHLLMNAQGYDERVQAQLMTGAVQSIGLDPEEAFGRIGVAMERLAKGGYPEPVEPGSTPEAQEVQALFAAGEAAAEQALREQALGQMFDNFMQGSDPGDEDDAEDPDVEPAG